MAEVTSGTNDAPFNGTWERSFHGYTASGAPTPDVGSATGLPASYLAVGLVPSGSEGVGELTAPFVILVVEDGTVPACDLAITAPDSTTATYAIDDAYNYTAQANGSAWASPSVKYNTYAWESQLSGNDFVDGEVTSIADCGPPLLNLQCQAAGNAGSDVLLQWSAPNCNDTQFVITQNGSTIATIPAINNGNNVFAGEATDFNYAHAVAQLTPNTEYAFSVTGDANGASNDCSTTTGCRGVEIFNCDCSLEPVQQTLAELRTRVMIRLGYPNQAANPPPGMGMLVDAFLYDAQKLIWKQLSRAGLNVERFFRWIMVPGQRYYGIDANADKCDLKLDPYKIVWAGFEDLNNAWYRLTEGIPPEFYTRANINFGWPTHYEVRSCIEIFPAPQAPYTLWIKGDFGLASFVDDDDTATIDDQAVFLLALGMAKSHYGQQDATAVLAQADTYIRGLVAGLHGTRRYVPRTKIQNPATPPRFLPLGDAQA